MGRRSRTARPRPGPGPDRESDPARTRTPTPTPTSPSSPPPRDQRVPVTDGNESSAHQPTTGDGTSPDPVAPDNTHAPPPPRPRDQRVPVPHGHESSPPQPPTGDGTSPAPVAPDTSHAPQPPVAPGHRDLPWKATAERRDLWGPTQRPLEGKVHSPANTASIGRPRRRPLVTFGVPVLVGGLIGIGALVLGLGAALAAPLLVAGGALGAGVLAAGGSGLLLRATRPAPSSLLEADVDIAEPTQQTLEKILQATATVRTRTSRLRTAVSEPTAGLALEHVDSLLRRIDALVGSETIQTLRPYTGELTMLDGMAKIGRAHV